MTQAISPSRSKKRRPSGATMVEAALVLLVFFGFIFLIIDVSMGILAKATLQHAVRSGVRYAVTSQTSGSLGQVDSIKQVVKAQSMGFLSTADLTYVRVNFYPASSTTTTPLADPKTGVPTPGANAAGNLVIVSVNAWPFKPIALVPHSGADIFITVSSGDLIESSGSGTTPPGL